MIKFIFSLLLVFSCHDCLSQWKQENFVIGAFRGPYLYNNYPTDIQQYQKVKDIDINIIVYPDLMSTWLFSPRGISHALDIAATVGLDYLVTDSRHMLQGGWGDTLPLEYFDSAKANLILSIYSSLDQHKRSALHGYVLKDEPAYSKLNPSHINFINDWTEFFKRNEMNKLVFVDLVPVYAIGANFKNFTTIKDYEDYIREYSNNENYFRDLDVVIYNNYLCYHNLAEMRYFYNISLIKKMAKSKPCWGHIDVHPRGCCCNPDENYINFSVNSHLAYGFKGIIYFPYSDINREALVKWDKTTKRYYWVEKINKYIKNLIGPIIMSSEHLGCFHKSDFHDFYGNILEVIPDSEKVNENTPMGLDICNTNSMVGIFCDKNNCSSYFFIVNKGFADSFAVINDTISLEGNFIGKVYTASNIGPDWNFYLCEAFLDSNITKIPVSNLKPGEGRIFKIEESGLGGWNYIYHNFGDSTNHPVPGDYDGDGKDDLSIKNDAGYWKIDYSGNGFGIIDHVFSKYGGYDAIPVPGDYDGDGKTDLSVKTSWGTWYINYSSNGFQTGWDASFAGFGNATSHPVPGDYDGDGICDLSVKDDLERWKIDYSSNGFGGIDITLPRYGGIDAHPVPADYDGDGMTDLSVKVDWGDWFINYAYNGFQTGWDVRYSGYGDVKYQPCPADYDGDGKADLCVRTSYGSWIIDYACNGFSVWDEIIRQCSTDEGVISIGDYDGDGLIDFSIKNDNGDWLIGLNNKVFKGKLNLEIKLFLEGAYR